MKIITAAQMRELDRRTIEESGISEKKLIFSAGCAVANWVASRYSGDQCRILALVGKGNNGADALVAAQQLQKRKYRVRVVHGWKPEALRQIQAEIQKSRVEVLVLDGLLGTGLNRSLTEPLLSLVAYLAHSQVEIIALDIPSGLHADTGEPLGASLIARHTLTFGLAKLGLVQEHAADKVGQLHVLDIGFSPELVKTFDTPYRLIRLENVAPFFKRRKRNIHKGDLGHVLVIGGSTGMAGAPALAARAALRTGAGLVSMVAPRTVAAISAALAGAAVMVHPADDGAGGFLGPESLPGLQPILKRATAVVLGPGLGRSSATLEFVQILIQSLTVPLLLDADGLNLIAENPSILRTISNEVVITPHPGEMGRLAHRTVEEVQRDRFGIAGTFARDQRVTVVLKGARTIVAHPSPVSFQEAGDVQSLGFCFSVNALAGNPGMATAGCGDVLSGMIGALLARGLPARDAACAGVFLHAQAGDASMSEKGGGIADDLIEAIRVGGLLGKKARPHNLLK